MRDLTEELSTAISRAINEFRSVVEGAQEKLQGDIAAAHQVYEVASSLRIEQAHKDMAAQITTFLGQPKPLGPTVPRSLPDVADGPSVSLNTDADNGTVLAAYYGEAVK
jgi:hypothetical protein